MKTCPVCDTPFPDQRNTCPTDGAVLIESQDLIPGHIVRGKYRIIAKLGQGGMGVVYLAEHLMLGGQMALKFLAVELSRNPQFVKRFRNEARAAYQLRHPNIVEVADLDQEEDGCLFIAMEYVSGPSLRAALREANGPLPVERALHIARGVAAGLGAAHARGAIHRDIKPENLLLGTAPDGREQAKVLDFGIAVMTDALTNLSRTHGLLLTPEYAAPEQWRGTPANELDGRTDLYALGGVLYEMLCGQPPFRAVNAEGWMFQHLQGTPEPLCNLRPELARDYPGLDAIVLRLLAREREQRFPSAAALLEALSFGQPARTEFPVEASPYKTALTEPQFKSPGPGLSLGAAVGRQTEQPPIESAPRLADSPIGEEKRNSQVVPAPRRGTLKWIAFAVLVVLVLGLGAWFAFRWFRPMPQTAVPTLTPGGGTYSQPQAVTISDTTSGAIIHYTVDGSPPTGISPVYTGPVMSLASGGVVRAMATAEGHGPSSDVTGVYIWSGGQQHSTGPPETGVYDQAKDAYDHKQYPQARTLFGQACDSGELRACNYLGYLYARGFGGVQDEDKARAIYQAACERGNLSSCASLGSLYQDAGKSDEARKYFKRGCDGGLAAACTLLRDMQ